MVGAIIYTGYSCSRQEINTEMAAELPQITNKTELENALSGTKKMYAVLNAPVSGSPVDDAFDILTDEYFYIRYSGEMIKLSVYYQDGL